MLGEKYYTVADVAEFTGMTGRTIRNYLKDGTLTGTKIGVQWRFTEEDIRRLFHKESFVIETPTQHVRNFISGTDAEKDRICSVIDLADLDEESGKALYEDLQKKNPDLKLSQEYFDDTKVFRICLSGEADSVASALRLIKKKTS